MSDYKVFMTESGMTLRLRPVRERVIGAALERIEQAYRERGEPLDVPTYTTPIGEVFEHKYEEGKVNTLDVPGDAEQSAQNWAMWNRHNDARDRCDAEKGEERIVITLALGVEDFEIPDDGWIDELSWAGVDVTQIPEDPRRRKAYYLQMVALSPVEVQLLFAQIMALSNVPAEKRELFRQAIVDQMGRAIGSLVGKSETGAGAGVVDRKPAILRVEGHDETFMDAGPMGPAERG